MTCCFKMCGSDQSESASASSSIRSSTGGTGRLKSSLLNGKEYDGVYKSRVYFYSIKY